MQTLEKLTIQKIQVLEKITTDIMQTLQIITKKNNMFD